jgi:hypothetical protein
MKRTRSFLLGTVGAIFASLAVFASLNASPRETKAVDSTTSSSSSTTPTTRLFYAEISKNFYSTYKSFKFGYKVDSTQTSETLSAVLSSVAPTTTPYLFSASLPLTVTTNSLIRIYGWTASTPSGNANTNTAWLTLSSADTNQVSMAYTGIKDSALTAMVYGSDTQKYESWVRDRFLFWSDDACSKIYNSSTGAYDSSKLSTLAAYWTYYIKAGWSDVATAQQSLFKGATSGLSAEYLTARLRYDYIISKHLGYTPSTGVVIDDFIFGTSSSGAIKLSSNNGSSNILIISLGSLAIVLTAAYFLLKKKKVKA